LARNDVQLEIGGDATGLTAALRQAVEGTRAAATQMSSALDSVTSAFGKIQSAALGLTAIIGGGALFGRMIEDSKKATEDAINLGKTLGVSASTASAYGVALASVGGNADDFGHAIQTLTRQVKTHEGALNDMGIKTRDAGGHLRDMNDVFFDAVNVVNSYSAGMDRDLAAQTAFGRGATASSAIFRLTKKDMEAAKVSATELGLVVGKQNVEDFEANRKATAGAHQVLQGLGKAISDELLPVLTHLAEWFRSIGPAAIGIVRTAVANLVSVFWGLDIVVVGVWETLKAMVLSIVGPLSSLAKAVYDALHGNFAQAKEDIREIGPALVETWKDSFNKTVDEAKLAAEKIRQAFTDATGDAGAPKKGKEFHQPAPKEKDDVADELAKRQQRAMQEAWREITASAAESAKAQEAAQVGSIGRQLEAVHAAANAKQISAHQEMTQTEELLNAEWTAQQNYYGRLRALYANDQKELGKIEAEEEAAHQQHLTAMQKADEKYAAQTGQLWRDVGKSMDNAISSSLAKLLQGTQSLAATMRSLMVGAANAIAQAFAKQAASNIVEMGKQALVGKSIRAQEIRGDAGAAAAGAYRAIVGIPYVGPILAPIAAAVAYGGVMAFDSAEGGYDIPGGLNPLVQTHAREMILPANLADTIRGLAANGGPSAGSGDVHNHTWNVNAIDARSFDQFLRTTGGRQIAQEMARQYQGFNPALRGNRA